MEEDDDDDLLNALKCVIYIIYFEVTRLDNQINDKCTIKYNPIFNIIINKTHTVGIHRRNSLYPPLTVFSHELQCQLHALNTLRTGSLKLFKLFKRPFPGFLTILTF